jgi:Family of unknown function (DUF6459)
MTSAAPAWPDEDRLAFATTAAPDLLEPLRPVGTAAAGFELPREPSDRELAVARRRARRHLPSPTAVTRDIAMALLEVEAGCRSAVQLERVCSPELWAGIEHRLERRGGPLPSGRALLRVHCQEDLPGLADTVAVVQRGDRVQPVAMRLDASGGRWAVIELRFWRCETDAGASPPCNRAAGW